MAFNNNKLYYSAVLLQFILGCFLYISKNCMIDDKYFTEKKDWSTDYLNEDDIDISSFRCRRETELVEPAFNPIELDTIGKDGVEIKNYHLYNTGVDRN